MIRPTLCRFFRTSTLNSPVLSNRIGLYRESYIPSNLNGKTLICNNTSLNGLPTAIINNRTPFLSSSKRCFGSYIEEYYTTNHAATGFSSPLRKSFAAVVFIAQATLTFGYLLHTNYYFTGKALPKTDGQTQLCSDSR